MAVLAARLLVRLVHTLDVRVAEHAHAVPARAAGRRHGATAPHQARTTVGERTRCDVDVTAVDVDRSGAQLAQQIEFLVDEAPAGAHVDAELFELLGPVTQREDVGHPPLADDVEHGHVLGEPNRVVERQQQDAAIVMDNRLVRAAIAEARISGDGR